MNKVADRVVVYRIISSDIPPPLLPACYHLTRSANDNLGILGRLGVVNVRLDLVKRSLIDDVGDKVRKV